MNYWDLYYKAVAPQLTVSEIAGRVSAGIAMDIVVCRCRARYLLPKAAIWGDMKNVITRCGSAVEKAGCWLGRQKATGASAE